MKSLGTINTPKEFENLVKQDKPILLDFYADWCGPCQTLLPTVEKLSNEYDGKVEIKKVNVEENKGLAAYFKVRSIPALFFIKDATVVDSITGLVPEKQLRQKLDAIIQN